MSLRIHCFQQVPFENLGCIKNWCNVHNHKISYTRFYNNDAIPAIEEYDWLIIMGGPMGIYDYEQYPWLQNEKTAIEKAIKANKTVLGICLGSQFIADVLGAKVYSGSQNEIGWYDINLTNQAENNLLFKELPHQMKVFHWHGDTYEIPNNTTRIAYSALTENQGFIYKDKVVALQFHFEITEDSLKNMISNCGSELIENQYVQTADQILSNNLLIKQNNKYMFQLLNNLNKPLI